MAKEEKDTNEAQIDVVDTPQSATTGAGANGYKAGALGLIGGVIGAGIIMVAAPLFQQNTVMSQIEYQANRIDEAKTDREKEFSRVFEAISELNEKSRTHEATIKTLESQVRQTTRMQGNQATKLQDLTQVTVGLSADIDGLKDLLAGFEARSQPSELSSDQPDGREEVATLKAQISILEEKVETLPQLMRQLEEEKAARLSMMDDVEEVGKKIFDALYQHAQENKQFMSHVNALVHESQVGDISLAMLIAANSLKAAVDRGGSYREEWEAFSPLAPHSLQMEMLMEYADSGLPNNVELSRRFARLADEIAATENTLPEGAGLTDQLLHQGSQLYSSRPVGDVEGDGAAAIAARMEVAIAEGDLTRALSEYRALPQEAKDLAADFIKILQARQEADALLSRFISRALQEENRQQ